MSATTAGFTILVPVSKNPNQQTENGSVVPSVKVAVDLHIVYAERNKMKGSWSVMLGRTAQECNFIIPLVSANCAKVFIFGLCDGVLKIGGGGVDVKGTHGITLYIYLSCTIRVISYST